MEKRLFDTFPLTKEFRRIYGWRANWKRVNPEFISFGWSMFGKHNTANRAYTWAVKNNLDNRSKKDGVGTFADLGCKL